MIAPERAEQGGLGLGGAFPAVVHQHDEAGEPDRVGEEHALVMGVGRGLADAVEEVEFSLLDIVYFQGARHHDLSGQT